MSPRHNLQPGDVVITAFPTSDLKLTQRRPALVMLVTGEDVTVTQVTTKHNGAPERADDYKIEGWRESGLDRESYIRPAKVFTVESSLCRRIGLFPPAEYALVKHRFEQVYGLKSPAEDLQQQLLRLRQEIHRWQDVSSRLPGQPRTPEALARALNNIDFHIRRLEKSLAARRSGLGPARGR